MVVLGAARRLRDGAAGLGADQREQAALERALVQLGAVADAELRQRVEQGLERDALGVEQQLVLGAQHADLGEQAALVRQQRRVDAGAGRDGRDVVGEQRVEVGGGVRAADRELAALGAVEQRDAPGRGLVAGVARDESIHREYKRAAAR